MLRGNNFFGIGVFVWDPQGNVIASARTSIGGNTEDAKALAAVRAMVCHGNQCVRYHHWRGCYNHDLFWETLQPWFWQLDW